MAVGKRRGASISPTDNGTIESNGATIDNTMMDGKKKFDTEHHAKDSGWLLLGCFLGIFVSYFIYGLLQETISKRDFDGEKFNYFMFLVWFQCLINVLIARIASWYKGESLSISPHGLFAGGSFSYVCAMVASNSSLAFINYPTQVLGKSVKPIPVLVLGVLIGRRSYPLIKYLCVLLIVVGVGIFLYKEHAPGRDKNDEKSFKLFDTIGFGEILLLISLVLDGITGVLQDKLKVNKISGLHMMYAMNFFAPIFLTIGLVVTGEGLAALGFLSRHPYVILNMIMFSSASGIGQIFIFTTITTFGPLTCSIITTTRKFFTILGSVLLFGNSLLPRQWIGVVFVFIGLTLDVYFDKRKKKVNSQPQNA